MNIAPLRLPLLATALALCCAHAGADEAKPHARFVAGIHQVVPEYKAGSKFRTPEAPDSALVEDIAKRLRTVPATVRAEPTQRAALLSGGKTDALLLALGDDDPLRRNATVIPTGYVAAPMAIMRTDTDIRRWEQLKGRTVCVSEGGLYAGTLAARYGAIEMPKRAPADALLALRIGECDATVHDSALLEELLKMPEWKKFSARLPAGAGKPLSFVVPAADTKTAAALRQAVADWQKTGYLRELTTKAARSIAFEVYLDQNVPDCH